MEDIIIHIYLCLFKILGIYITRQYKNVVVMGTEYHTKYTRGQVMRQQNSTAVTLYKEQCYVCCPEISISSNNPVFF